MRLDHLVLTDETVRFYTAVLGMELVRFGAGRFALRFGDNKINLHEAGREVWSHALRPAPGSRDLCLVFAGDPAAAIAGPGLASPRTGWPSNWVPWGARVLRAQ